MARPKLTVVQGGNLTPTQKRERKTYKDELRKRMLDVSEVNAMLKRYGIKIDGLPLNTLGHARRMFNLAQGNVMAMTSAKGQRAQWVVFIPELGYWTVETATLVAEGYVVAVGDILRTWAEQLQQKLDEVNPKKPLSLEEQMEIESLIDKLHKEADKLQGPGRSSVLSMAMVRKPEAFMDHHINETLFDADPDHLVVKNGVVNLRTGRLTRHDPGFKMTRHLDVNYDSSALKRTNSRFLGLVAKMFPDPGVLPFIHKLTGYFATGHTSEQVAAVFLGSTGTGKSTYWKAIANTLGETHRNGYTTPATAGLLRVKSSHWGDTATIEHARILIDSETGEDTILDGARLKRLTGEQSITTNAKYGKHKTFTITGKIVLQTNHAPVFAGGNDDEAIYRRLFIVPCNVTMYEDGWDEGTYLAFEEALHSDYEREVVLAWLVAGAKAWYAAPMRASVPEAVTDQLKALRARSGGVDHIQDALTDADYEITFLDTDVAVAQEIIDVVQTARPLTTKTAIGRWCAEHGVRNGRQTADYEGTRKQRAVYLGIKKKQPQP